ncbi:MAG: radical SAM protein [Candidatus Aminicenantes bacterium]|nr:radical SAM protein [Candidatus Aminicenantes bacterium]
MKNQGEKSTIKDCTFARTVPFFLAAETGEKQGSSSHGAFWVEPNEVQSRYASAHCYTHTSCVVSENVNRNLVVLVSLMDDRIPFAGESLGILAISGYLQAQKRAVVRMFDMQLSSVDEVIEYIKTNRPGMLGFSVKHNSLNQLLDLYSRMDDRIPHSQRPVLVVGNTLPGYIDETLLRKLLPDSVIGLGEGEVCMGDMFDFVQGTRHLSDVRNIAYLDAGTLIRRPIVAMNKTEYALPDRSLSKMFYERGGLIYSERSRGCPWGSCTFCPREHEPMRNPKNNRPGRLRRGPSWRVRDTETVIEDLKQLQNLGIKNVRFADEDFIGPGLPGIQSAQEFAKAVLNQCLRIHFDVIARVDSVFNDHDDKKTRIARKQMWSELVEAGLVKVALGVETFSPNQLKRYGKGVTIKETIEAIRILKRDLQLEIEVGFISVDVMSTLDDIQDTLFGLRQHESDLYASTAFKEMRVYHNTPYLRLVRAAEREFQRTLLGPLNINTLEYAVERYLNDDVDILARHLRQWNGRAYELFYLLRIYTNTSSQAHRLSAANESVHHCLPQLIEDWRRLELQVLLESISTLQKRSEGFKEKEFQIDRLVKRYEVHRYERVRGLAALLDNELRSFDSPLAPLKRDVMSYLERAERYITALPDHCCNNLGCQE